MPQQVESKSAQSMSRTIAFFSWLAAFPVLAGVCFVGLTRLPMWFTFVLPLFAGFAAVALLVAAAVSGIVTKTLIANMAGLLGGIGVVLIGFMVMNAVDRAAWNATYDEFRAFSEIVSRGDRQATTSAFKGLRNFTPGEALCVLGANDETGGSGYLMPHGLDEQREKTGARYFISTPRLFDAAEVVVTLQPAKRETQVALKNMLEVLISRGDQAMFGQWKSLWSRTKSATGGASEWRFDGPPLSRALRECGPDDESRLYELVKYATKPPPTADEIEAERQRQLESVRELEAAYARIRADEGAASAVPPAGAGASGSAGP